MADGTGAGLEPAGGAAGCCGELGTLGGGDPDAGAGVGLIGELGVLGAAGVGMRVMVDGTLAMMPGFCGMWGAQIPAR